MCSETSHLGGKMTKSSNATPGLSVGAVNTTTGQQHDNSDRRIKHLKFNEMSRILKQYI